MTADTGYSASIDDLAAREEALHPVGDAIDVALDRLPGDPGDHSSVIDALVLAAGFRNKVRRSTGRATP